MKHVDALNWNPLENMTILEMVLQIQPVHWLLSAQLTDTKVKEIRDSLSRTPGITEDRQIHKNYYRTGLQENRTWFTMDDI